jgi:hypothetical protein
MASNAQLEAMDTEAACEYIRSGKADAKSNVRIGANTMPKRTIVWLDGVKYEVILRDNGTVTYTRIGR